MFPNEAYDWYAEVHNISDVYADKPMPCRDCCRKVLGPMQAHEMYEFEECRNCGEDADGCQCTESSRGEYDEFCICSDCRDFRLAISAVEADEGSPHGHRQPMYGDLVDGLQGTDWRDYVARAEVMLPHLRHNGYLAMIETQLP